MLKPIAYIIFPFFQTTLNEHRVSAFFVVFYVVMLD